MIFEPRLLAVLPAPSRAKIERLDADRDAAHAAYRDASDWEQEARHAAALAASTAEELAKRAPGYAFSTFPGRIGAAAAAEQETVVDRLSEPARIAKERHRIAEQARDRAAEKWAAFAFLGESGSWLDRAVRGGVTLKHFAPAPPKSKSFAASVEGIRAELHKLDGAWSTAENAPAPASELKARAIAEIDALAAQGAPTIYARSRGGSPIGLAEKIKVTTFHAPGEGGANVSIAGGGGAPFFVWLMRDAIADRIAAEIDAAMPSTGILSDDQREARFAEITARRLELERDEEALISAAEASGHVIARRREADPRAILEVEEI